MLNLKPLTTMTAAVDYIASTRRMGVGTRQNYIVSGGTLEGALSGKVLPGGGDYLLVDANGLGHVDARLTWELDGGAIVYVQYLGKIVMTDQVAEAFKSAGDTAFGDTHFITQLRFECGYEQFSWLNQAVAIGEGRVAAGRCIQYQIHLCENQ